MRIEIYTAPPKMDLGSSLEKQQQEYTLQQEEHELPTLPEKKRTRNIIGATVSVILVVFDFLLMCGGLTTLAVFVVTTKSVTKGCILFASYDTKNSQPFQLGEQSICYYVIWSMVAISIIGALYICGLCSRACCSLCFGLSTFNLLSVCDFIIYVFMTLISISVGLIVRIGHMETCDAVYKVYPEPFSNNITNCSGPSLVNDVGDEVNISNNLFVTEISAWATSIILLVISLIHAVLLLGYLLKCYGSRKKKDLSINNNEESLFRQGRVLNDDDDDEPLLDPASDTWDDRVDSDHTSFPPYNLGYPPETD